MSIRSFCFFGDFIYRLLLASRIRHLFRGNPARLRAAVKCSSISSQRQIFSCTYIWWRKYQNNICNTKIHDLPYSLHYFNDILCNNIRDFNERHQLHRATYITMIHFFFHDPFLCLSPLDHYDSVYNILDFAHFR